MDWNLFNYFRKNNPAQEEISWDYGIETPTDQIINYPQAFEKLESVNRGTNMVVSASSGLDYDIKDKVYEGIIQGVRAKQLNTLLNFRPNPYQSVQEFRRAIFTDYILEGNIFIYWDGAFMYHIPSVKCVVHSDPKTFVSHYTYGEVDFAPNEIIHIKDISSDSIYRGSSRLASAKRSIDTLYNMQQFQDQFFINGAVAGIVLETDNTLSQQAKDKTIDKWRQQYSPKNGARRPLILDSGLKLKNMSATSFQEMDFDTSIERHDEKILTALGVPPILLNGGNNANISPNLRLFYLETIIPIIKNYISGLERFFGYDIDAITSNVSALQPELKEIASYHTTLVNGGIITPNEAREELRYEKLDGLDDIRVPANIAGSAVDPSQGGAPKKDDKGDL